jgi:hypothetical protein
MQGISSYRTGKQDAADEKRMGKYNEAVGQTNAARQRQLVAAQQSQLVAESGSSGTLMTGSPMEVYLANARQGEITAQDEIAQGRLAALSNYKKAQNSKQKGTSELIGGVGGAVKTIGSFNWKT